MTTQDKFVLDVRRTREALHRLRLARRTLARLSVIWAISRLGGARAPDMAEELTWARQSAETWASIARSWLRVLATTRRELISSKAAVCEANAVAGLVGAGRRWA